MKKIKTNAASFKQKEVIPVFFASDRNYLPYLSVCLQSLKRNASVAYNYKIIIHHQDVTEKEMQPILNQSTPIFDVQFLSIADRISAIKSDLQLRDYYTGATYFRILIPDMFPEYDKAIYLDCDTIVLGDISKLYSYKLGNNLVGAVSDKVVASNRTFRRYAREVLGISPEKYFNAGILVMNLKLLREQKFFTQFCNLLKEYRFTVAQDQDYLNVICKGKVRLLPYCWNTMPIGGEGTKEPCLIHYNLTLKPWHYPNIPYSRYFWEFASKSRYASVIRQELNGYTEEKKQADALTEQRLVALAKAEIEREDNFIKARSRAVEQTHFNLLQQALLDTAVLIDGDNDYDTIGVKG